jgi:hypothetical protein
MTNITESSIEQSSIDLLVKQGFQYIYGPDIAPDSEAPLPSEGRGPSLHPLLGVGSGRHSVRRSRIVAKNKKLPDNQIAFYQTADGATAEDFSVVQASEVHHD